MKKMLSMILALVLCMGIGCALAEGGAEASLASLAYILEKGTLVMGLDDSFPPMGYRNENNEIVGYDVDVAREVAARLGVELVLQPIDWAAKELELSTMNIDCIWNGMSITPEREESMALSSAYLNNMIVFLVNDPAYQAREDLAGKAIGVQSGSFAEEVIGSEEYADFAAGLSEIAPYEEYLTAILDLQNGNIQAVAIDLVVANFQIANLGDESLFVIDDLADDLYAVGFRKEDVALRDKVDEILLEMAADGKLAEISGAWFGEDINLIGKE